MKNYILPLILVLNTGICIAQSGFENMRVKVNKPLKMSAVDDLREFIYVDETEYHAFGLKNKKRPFFSDDYDNGMVKEPEKEKIFIRMDKELKVLSTIALEDCYDSKVFDLETRISSNGRHYFFTSKLVEEKTKREIFIQEYIPLTMTLSAPKKFGETIWSPNINALRGLGTIRENKDKSLRLFQYIEPHEKESPRAFSYCVADKDMKVLYNRRHVFSGEQSISRVLGIDISNSGDVLVMARCMLNDADDEGETNSVDKYKFFIFSDEGELTNEVVIDFGDKLLRNFRMRYTDDNSIVLTGFYQYDKSVKDSYDGVFYKRFAPVTYVEEASNFVDFSGELRSNMLTEEEKEEEAKGKSVPLSNIDLRTYFFNEDGSVVFIGERIFEERDLVDNSVYVRNEEREKFKKQRDRQNWNNQNFPSNRPSDNIIHNVQPRVPITIYKHLDIIAVSFNSKGELMYNITIPKHQEWQDSKELLSFAAINNGEDCYLIFNDNLENLTLTDGEPTKFSALNKVYVCVAKIDKNGTVTRDKLVAEGLKKFYSVPLSMISLENQFILPIQGGALEGGINLLTLDFE
ncbi:MAG: hypothetical protein GC193_12820 [Cryomorphaceae bacterium]|nr:hypothetical protein [Cryomorphaceae bacterium]